MVEQAKQVDRGATFITEVLKVDVGNPDAIKSALAQYIKNLVNANDFNTKIETVAKAREIVTAIELAIALGVPIPSFASPDLDE